MPKITKEQYEDLFVFLRNNSLFGTRLELDVDNVLGICYLNGYTKSNSFMIDIKEDGVSLVFSKEEPGYEGKLVALLNYYYQDSVDVSYNIMDLGDVDNVMKAYEWTSSKEKIEAIKKSESIKYPHYITNVKTFKEREVTKEKKR